MDEEVVGGQKAKPDEMLSDEDRERLDVGNIYEQDIRERIDEVAQKYHFESSDWLFSRNTPESNKAFLTMLDDYLSEAELVFPEKEELQVLDFGSGQFPYLDGYNALFQRYGKKENEPERKVKFTAWDSGERSILPRMDQISTHIETREDPKSLFQMWEKPMQDVVTMLGMGPSANLTDPKIVEKSFQEAIIGMGKILNEDGVMILTTSFGGPKHDNIIEYLREAGLEIILDQENKYKKELKDFPFEYNDVIIAKKLPS